MSAPDTIYVDTWGHSLGNLDPADIQEDYVQYIRSDLAPNAAYVAGLEAALLDIDEKSSSHLTSAMCRNALSSRPATPAMRVVTDNDLREAIGRAWCHEENVAKEMDIDLAEAVLLEIRAIIGETK